MPGKEIEGDLIIPDRLLDLLVQKKYTVAVAESVTAGHLQVAFSLAEGAHEFFQGGITVYNLAQKVKHLQVDPAHALTCNSVSEQVAAEMAKHATRFFMSDWGIAITGYASPIPEKNLYDLFACYSIYHHDKEMIRHTVKAGYNSPSAVRKFYTQHVLNHFLEILSKE